MTPAIVKQKAKSIRLLALDVDGVLTDGKLYFSANGDEIKTFNTLDGHGIKNLMQNGIDVAVITGRKSPLTERRVRDLGIQHLTQGREDKLTVLTELAQALQIELSDVAYVGDDLPDLGAIRAAGLGITVPNGHDFVQQYADWITERSGGSGAVREVSDMLLDAKGVLQEIHERYL